MSSSKKGGGQVPNLVNSDEDDKALQAIVITDSFNERFIPISLDKPRCLLPLVNLPLIEYVFECLAISGVEEVILFTRHQTELIREYIASSRWSKPNSVLQVTIVVNQEAESVGDVLRDIDSRAVIHGDFVLVNCADIVSNVNLSTILTEHRVRRRLLPGGQNFVMTIITMPANPGHRTRERCESGIWSIEPVSGELLAYEQMECESDVQIGLQLSLDTIHAAAATASSCSSALMLLADSQDKEQSKHHCQSSKKKNSSAASASPNSSNTTSLPSAAHAIAKSIPKEVRVRFDLIDCGIDICSPHVLALFTENFDYDDLRRDFVKGVLTSDILGMRLAIHVLPQGSYAARVRSPRLYDAISRDIIERWVYPIVPESNLIENSPYLVKRNFTYQAPDILLSRDSLIKNGSVIGSGSSIGMFGSSPPTAPRSEHNLQTKQNTPTPPTPLSHQQHQQHQQLNHHQQATTIEYSVLGKRCQIGVNVTIAGSYLWDDVKVSPGCHIKNSIISEGVTLLPNTKLESGCLVGSNVTLGPNVTISRSSRITKLGEHCDMGAGLPLNSVTEDDPEGCLIRLNSNSRASLGEGSDGVLVSGSLGDYESFGALSFDALRRINNEDPFGSQKTDSTTSLDSTMHDAERESSFPTWIRRERQKAFTIDADNLFSIPILFDYLSEDEEADIVEGERDEEDDVIGGGEGGGNELSSDLSEFNSPNTITISEDPARSRRFLDHSSSSKAVCMERPPSTTPSHLASTVIADSQFLKGELGFLADDDYDDDLSIDMDSLSIGGGGCSKKSHSIFGKIDQTNNTFGRNNTKFMREASDLIMHAIETDYLIDNALLELNSLKFSCNATFADCRAVLVGSIFTFIKVGSADCSRPSNEMAKEIDELLSRWSPMLVRFTQGSEEQMDLICCTQKACQSMAGLERAFQYVIPSFYKNDVVEQESIVGWWQQALKVLGADNIYVRQIKNFVEWLEDSDDDDDDDGDSDDGNVESD